MKKLRTYLQRFSPKQIMVCTIILFLVYLLLELNDVFPAGNGMNVFMGLLVLALVLTEWVHPRK